MRSIEVTVDDASELHTKDSTILGATFEGYGGEDAPDAADQIAPGLGSELGLKVLKPRIRSSAVATLHDCPRKFLYECRLGLKPRGFSPALETGTVYHLIMAALYAGQPETRAGEAAAQYAEKLAESLEDSADEGGFLPGGMSIEKAIEDSCQACQLGQAMAIANWRDCPFPADEWDVLAVEKLIDIDLKSPRIPAPIRVRLDLLLKHRETKLCWITDHKTTSKSPTQRAAALLYDFQSHLYRIGATFAFPNEEIAGILHNITQKPTIRYCGKDPNYEHYIKRVQEWYGRQSHDRPADPPIIRSRVHFKGTVLPRELHLQLREASRACRAKPDLEVFHRNSSACLGRYGSLCPHLTLCSMPPMIWCELIPGKYQVRDRDAEDEQQ